MSRFDKFRSPFATLNRFSKLGHRQKIYSAVYYEKRSDFYSCEKLDLTLSMKDVQITSTLNPLPKYESSSCSRSRSTQKKESQWKVKETSKERQRNAKTISKFWNWGKVNAEQRLGSEVANNPKKARTFTSQPDFWLKKMTLWKPSLKLCKENYISSGADWKELLHARWKSIKICAKGKAWWS